MASRTPGPESGSGHAAAIEHRHLRSALEFAVLIASEGQKRKPPIPFPKELKAFFNKPRLAAGSLGRIRRILEADDVFRARLAAGAAEELVDEIGRLWLSRPEGWEADATRLAVTADEEAETGDLAKQVKRAERRREAAEQATARTRVELVQLNELVAAQRTELDELRAAVAKADEALAELRTELVDARVEIRHARDREAAAQARADAARQKLKELNSGTVATAESGGGTAHPASSQTPAPEPPEPPQSPEPPEPSGISDNSLEIAAAARLARSLSEQLAEQLAQLAGLLPADAGARVDTATGSPGKLAPRRPRPARRKTLKLPGGVISTSREAAEFLVKSDAAVLIDGYNVSMLGWPDQPLEQQRRSLLDGIENLAKRHGTDVTVVFDGASVVGAHTDRRRLARVVYSSAGVIADDVIRDEVQRLPTSRHVVVVTNDAEIVRDVRAAGANVLPSNALLAVL